MVGDISNKLEEVSGQMAGMDIEGAAVQELQERSKRCIELLRPSVTTFVELSLFCAANEVMEKLEAMLGEKHAASLGVSAGGRDMRMKTVLKAVKEAFEIRAYGKALMEGQSRWSQIRCREVSEPCASLAPGYWCPRGSSSTIRACCSCAWRW